MSALENELLNTNFPLWSLITRNFIQSTRTNGPPTLPITSSFPPNIFTIIVLLLSSSIVVTVLRCVKVWLGCLCLHGKVCHRFRQKHSVMVCCVSFAMPMEHGFPGFVFGCFRCPAVLSCPLQSVPKALRGI